MSLITFDNKSDSVSNPAPRQNKVIADDINQLKNGVNYFYDASGWVSYNDTVNTEVSPQTLTALTDNVITIVDASPLVDEKPIDLGENELWASNKFQPIRRGDVYVLRLDFKAKIANANGYFNTKIDIGGAIGDLIQSELTFPKGANIEHAFSQTIMVYTMDTFLANGGEIQINPSHEMEIYDKRIVITRLYKGRSEAPND